MLARATASALQVPEELARKIRAAKDVAEGERKQVTVMFCDLAGSTALAEQLDPEVYHELLEEYLELAFRAVYRYEGLVNQLAGDGFMALFGAPLAHEDAPQRAVHAALQIQSAMATLNTRLDSERGLTLRVRVGIHTGPVVVGAVGNDLKMDYSAIGDTTNLAARLESLAQPGAVLVSEATYRLIRARFNVRPLGPLKVKGKREPIVAYEVIELSEAARQEPSAPLSLSAERGLTPFVGRDAELAQLLGCYQRLHDHLPQLVTVVGAAGSGKSRLLYELRERLLGEPVTWFEVRCSAWTQMLPYAPFAGMLRRYLDVMPDDPADQVREKVAERVRDWDPHLDQVYPWLCRILKLEERGTELSDEEMKSGTFNAMGTLIQRAAQHGAVIMFIEDLHWMDEPSREMLYAAAAQMHAWPFMLLVSHRPDFRPVWRTQPVLTEMHLRRLSDESVTAIIRSIAGGELPGDLERRILDRAEGSPFLAEEMTRALLEEGCLTCEVEGEIKTRSVDEIRIPSTVQEVVAARLDRLPPAAKRVVQHAAVMGRQFSRRLLVDLLSDEEINVDRELDELERRGVVHRRNVFSNDEYRFGESLTQEVAYEGLLLRQRRQLHERIGVLLEQNPVAADSERSAMLMHHFGLSDNRAKSAKALLRAASEAEKVPSYTTAARLYRQAWDLAYDGNGKATDTDLQRLALQAVNGIGRMAVIYNVPDPGDNSQVLESARRLAEALEDYGSQAALYTYEGMLLMQRDRSHFADGLARVEKGSELARRAPDPLPAVTTARALSYGYMIDGRLEPARQLLDFVIEQLDRAGLSQQLADLYCSASWMRDRIDFFRDDLDRAIQGTVETMALASRVGNRTVRSSACMLLGHVALVRGEYTEALRWIEESLSVMAVIGPHWNASTASAIGLLASGALGRHEHAGRFVDLIAQSSAPSNDLALNSHVVTEALLLAGELEFAERRAQSAYERAGGRLRELHSTLALAAVQAQRGGLHLPEAHHSFQHALGLAETLGFRSAIATASAGLAQVELSRGEPRQASRLLRRALRLWGELGMTHYEVQTASRLAALERGPSASDADAVAG